MATNTKALPVIDVSISGALRMQFMTTTVSKLELLSIFKILIHSYRQRSSLASSISFFFWAFVVARGVSFTNLEAVTLQLLIRCFVLIV